MLQVEIEQIKNNVMNLLSKDNVEKEDYTNKIKDYAKELLLNNENENAHTLLSLAKTPQAPVEDLDFLRAEACKRLGRDYNYKEALKEELRYFPNNKKAQIALNDLLKSENDDPFLNKTDKDFQKLYSSISLATMLPIERLYSLYCNAIDMCSKQIQNGAFVECGVAGGGSSAMVAYILKQFEKKDGIKRQMYCCDSFEGLPLATEDDISSTGESAKDTGWWNGACSGSEDNLISLCKKLQCEDIVKPIKGYFEETLPKLSVNVDPIAFLHMDGDWYSSTKAIIENLYDNLIQGAFVQVDDYSDWQGCKKAIEEFFDSRNIFVERKIVRGALCFRKP